MNSKVMSYLKINIYYTVPQYLFKNYLKLGLNEKQLIFVIYLLNQSDLILFNNVMIAEDLNIDKKEVLVLVSELCDVGLLEIKIIKNSNGVSEEYLCIDGFYNRVINLLADEPETNESNIFELFEKEFGKTLSPMEYEIINGWIDSKISEEVIVLALKEAVYNGVYNLRYIDKILYEWQKKGIKRATDVKLNKKQFSQENIEDFDYDWLNDK